MARVVVVTGASSGIGRSTAQLLAQRGDRLVLAARGREGLDAAAAECTAQGARDVLVVPTDMSDEEQVDRLVRSAVEAFGRIDVWVGAASVYSYGRVEDTPADVVRQVVETNLLGQFWTARALLPQLRRQGAGTLIVVGSVYARLTSPYVAPYIASKYGLDGFTRALRQEVRGDRGIHVCAVLPATVDTPIYQRAANYTGQRVRPLPPVVSPYRVARAVVRLADHPRREVVVGRVQRSLAPVHMLLPRLYDAAVVPVMDTLALRGGSVPSTSGAVLGPRPTTTAVTGAWRSTTARILGGAAVAAGGAAVAAGVRRGRQDS